MISVSKLIFFKLIFYIVESGIICEGSVSRWMPCIALSYPFNLYAKAHNLGKVAHK